jgi:D-alanyl-D-alanine carboxypeptidase
MTLLLPTRRAALVLIGAGAAAPAIGRAAEEADAALLDGVLAKTGAPALTATVFSPGAVAFLQARGRRRADRPDPVATADLWHIGSNCKSMTAVLYARLVEEGRARWGATLAELFPGAKLHPAWSAATVEDLMHHRSGVLDRAAIDYPWLVARGLDKAPVAGQRRALAEKVLAVPPAGRPGEFVYANANYVMVAAAIERIEARPWEEIIRARLFEPLGMASAGFGPPLGAQPWGHRTQDGKPVPVDPAGPGSDNPPLIGPAGRVHLDLADYAKYLRLFLTGGSGLLRPETVARLTTPPTQDKVSYALGWGIAQGLPWARGPLVSHDGSNSLWYCSAHLSPSRKLGMAIVSNDGERGRAAVQMLAGELMHRFADDAG